jgi:hypothetical protein
MKGYNCRFCEVEFEICTKLGAVHERFCGGRDRLKT